MNGHLNRYFVFALWVAAMSLCNIALAKTISVEGSDQGRVFEGIGAVSAGGNSRLLIDYEEPYRSNVCD
jgi:galactosylceramidase